MSIPRDPMAHIRAEILAQPEAERADYALDLLAFYLDPLPAFFDGCAALGLNLSSADQRVLFALDRRRGHFVTYDSLTAARFIDRPADTWDTQESVVLCVFRIRAALTSCGLPVSVNQRSGLGYCLDAPVGFAFEAAAGPDLFSQARA